MHNSGSCCTKRPPDLSFVDGAHLSTAGQIIIADYYYSLLTAPSEISFLAESIIQTTFGMIYGIQQQIDLSQRQAPGWNVWINGNVGYLQINNSFAGFPNDPGIESPARSASTITGPPAGSSARRSPAAFSTCHSPTVDALPKMSVR